MINFDNIKDESKDKICEKLRKALKTKVYTFVKRGDGRLHCRIPRETIRNFKTGEIEYKYKDIYARNKHELDLKREKAIMDLLEELEANDSLLLKVRLKKWLVKKKYGKVRPTTYDRLECTLKNQIFPAIKQFENKKVYDVTSDDIDYILKYNIQKGYSVSVIKKVYDFLADFFDDQCSDDKIIKNPMVEKYTTEFIIETQNQLREKREELRKMNPENLTSEERELAESPLRMQDREKMKFFTDEEISRIKDAANKKFKNGKHSLKQAIYFIFLLYAGLRAGEAVALKYENVNFEEKIAHITKNRTRSKDRDINGNDLNKSSVKENDPKSKQSRSIVLLSDNAIQILEELKASEPEGYTGYIVHDDEWQPISSKALQKRFYNLLRLAGIEKTGLHALRHTCASKLYEKTKGDTILVSAQLRHCNPSFTADKYIDLEEKYKKNVIADFEI